MADDDPTTSPLIGSVDRRLDALEAGGGSMVHHSMDFAFDTPDMNAGIEIVGLELAVGDRIMDVWFEPGAVPWSGGTAVADVGRFSSNYGLFTYDLSGVPLHVVFDSAEGAPQLADDGLLVCSVGGLTSLRDSQNSNNAYQMLPALVTSAGPLKLTVSDNGQTGSGTSSCTAGEASVHVLVLPA